MNRWAEPLNIITPKKLLERINSNFIPDSLEDSGIFCIFVQNRIENMIKELKSDYFSYKDFLVEKNKVCKLLDSLNYQLIVNNGNVTCEQTMEVIRHLRYLADKLEDRLNKTFDTIGDLGEEVIFKPTE